MIVNLHPDGTIDAQPCSRCEVPTTHYVEVLARGEAAMAQGVADGSVVLARYICEPCLVRCEDEIRELKKQFNQLLAMGVDRATANRIMIKRCDR